MKTNEVIYISGAISGTSDYMERFEKAEAFLKGKGYKVINPAKVMCPLDGVLGYEDMMDIDMMLIDRADIIFMLKGWRESKGANREYRHRREKCLRQVVRDDEKWTLSETFR